MAVNRSGNNLIYGFNNPLASLPNPNILSRRAPTSSDTAEIGTLWLYAFPNQQPQLYLYTSPATWTQVALDAGSTTFDSLTVNGPIQFNGSVDITTGNTHATIDTGTNDFTALGNVISLNDVIQISNNGLNKYNVFVNPGSSGLGEILVSNFNSFSITGNFFSITTNTLSIGQNGNVSTFNGHVASKPTSSNNYNANLTRTLTAGTAIRLTYRSNVIANICVTISSATSAVINIGVGASASPTVDAATDTFTVASTTIMNFSVMVPLNYYLLLTTTGTISISNITVFYTGI